MIVLSSIIPNFLNTKIYFLIHFQMLVTSLLYLYPRSTNILNILLRWKAKLSRLVFGTDATTSKNLTEEYVIADFHCNLTMWEG